MSIGLKKVIKLFEEGNVSVSGLKGRGKDMLMSNVAIRRKKPYLSNIDYGGEYNELKPSELSVGGNTYREFISGRIKPFEWKYEDGTDIYISDVGIYFPSQYNAELNKEFKEMPIFMALSRQLGDCSVHYNSQNLNRCWDKIREMSDTFILCRKCIYIKIFKLVIQRITIYDNMESAQKRMKPLKLPRIPLLSKNYKELKLHRETTIANFEASHGSIESHWLIYKNLSSYDTRVFRTILKGQRDEKNNNDSNSVNNNNITV